MRRFRAAVEPRRAVPKAGDPGPAGQRTPGHPRGGGRCLRRSGLGGRWRPEGRPCSAREYGVHRRGQARRWIVDPIDGTKNFVRGRFPSWATLLRASRFDGRIGPSGVRPRPPRARPVAGGGRPRGRPALGDGRTTGKEARSGLAVLAGVDRLGRTPFPSPTRRCRAWGRGPVGLGPLS